MDPDVTLSLYYGDVKYKKVPLNILIMKIFNTF